MATSACSHQGQQMAYGRKDSTAVVKKLYEASQRLYEEQEADSALSILLTATDYAKGCHDPEIRYLIYKDLSGAYEKKDLFDLQEKYLLLQLEAAQSMSDAGKTATSLFTLGVSYYAQGDNEKAIAYLDDAYHKAPSDSTKLRAKCQLMRCQVFLQTETLDSVVSSLHQARAEHPSIAEEEVSGVGIENLKGHYVAWNYYQTTQTPENSAFVAAYKKAYGEKRVTDDPIEAGYIGVYLWAMAAEKAGSFDVAKICESAKGLSFDDSF